MTKFEILHGVKNLYYDTDDDTLEMHLTTGVVVYFKGDNDV